MTRLGLFILSVIFLSSRSKRMFCSCAYSKTIKEETERSNLIFSGTPESVDTFAVRDTFTNNSIYYRQVRYHFKVEKFFKSELTTDTVSITTGTGGGDCGYRFTLGEKYLVFASSGSILEVDINELRKSYQSKTIHPPEMPKQVFRTNSCTWTGVYPRDGTRSDLVQELEKLKAGE